MKKQLLILSGALIAISTVLIASCRDDNFTGPSISRVSNLFASISGTTSVNNLLVFYKADSTVLAPSQQFANGATDANGVVYDAGKKLLFQLSRAKKEIFIYTNADSLTATSVPDRSIVDADLVGAQDLAYDSFNDVLYVSVSKDSAIYAYADADSTRGVNVQRKKYKLTAEPWGLTFVAGSNQLIVAMDKEARRVEVFTNVQVLIEGAITPSKVFNIVTNAAIDSNARLHGVTYSANSDLLAVTEIGQASSGDLSHTTDGAIYLFENFSKKASGNLTPSRTIIGVNTQLGNPVDVAIDDKLPNQGLLFVAEKANNAILVFKLSDKGDATPVRSHLVNSPEAVATFTR